jgi:hypothetical protein
LFDGCDAEETLEEGVTGSVFTVEADFAATG